MGLAVAILAVRGAVPEGLKLYSFPESVAVLIGIYILMNLLKKTD